MSPHTCYQITVHTTLNKVVSGYYKKYPFIAVMSLAPFILYYIIFKNYFGIIQISHFCTQAKKAFLNLWGNGIITGKIL